MAAWRGGWGAAKPVRGWGGVRVAGSLVLLVALGGCAAEGTATSPTSKSNPEERAAAAEVETAEAVAAMAGLGSGPGSPASERPLPPEAHEPSRWSTPTAAQRLAGLQQPPHHLPARSGSGKRVVYAQREQRVWLVRQDGSTARTYPVSGRLDQPSPGTYRVYSKSTTTYSSLGGGQSMRLMVRFTHGVVTGAAIGFHSIPVNYDGSRAQSVAQLGRPLSAGCVRQKTSDARALWRFSPVGTKVVVTT